MQRQNGAVKPVVTTGRQTTASFLKRATNFLQRSTDAQLSRSSLCWVALLCVGLMPPSLFAENPLDQELWQVLVLQGERVGYLHSTESHETVAGEPAIRSRLENHTSIKRFGQEITSHSVIETLERPSGAILTVRCEQHSPPGKPTLTVGRLEGAEFVLETTVDERTSISRIPYLATWRTPGYFDRWLRKQPLETEGRHQFEIFVPELSQPSPVVLELGPVEETPLWSAQPVQPPKTARLRRIGMEVEKLSAVKITAWVDGAGKTVKQQTSMLGLDLMAYTVDAATAQQAFTGANIDLALSTLVKTDNVAGLHASVKGAVIEVTCPDADLQSFFPPCAGVTSTFQKSSDPVIPSLIQLKLTPVWLPQTASVGQVSKEYLQPTPLLQSDDPLIERLTTEAIGDETDPASQARLLEKFVYERVRDKNFSTALASAAEVARDQVGDCTEHAVLLAAMLRAAGIPSRVAVGLVYVESLSAYGPHMWTEAALGETWYPLDSTLAQGGVGCGHLKLGESSLSEAGVVPTVLYSNLLSHLGKLKIRITEVKR